MATLMKVAWIRNDTPLGKPGRGHLNCPCGNAPESSFGQTEDIVCGCGTVYNGCGWIITSLVPNHYNLEGETKTDAGS